MNRLQRWIYNRLKAPQDIQTPDFLRAGLGSYGDDIPGLLLPTAQAELYQRLSWVYIAVSITSQTAAGAKFNVSKLQGEKTEAVENHPFELLLRRPNPLQSRFEFLEAFYGFRRLTGNAYVWLNRTSPTAPPSEMWIIPSSQIVPVPDERLYLRGYAYDPGDGTQIPLETWEICHSRQFHPGNRFVGLSAIESLALTAQGDMAMTKWNTNYFGRDHAKPAGGLAFADPINDSDWEQMKRDIKKEHGGTERNLMMLRAVGKGGVSWLQMGVSQKDMEFLQGRTFNKEEIFAALAPGLSSMLAINATEANSKTGKATFNEMTIWPMHQAVGEKFTSDILPSYGDNLIGEFEDVRVSDRAMELAEQQTAFKVMTIKEARERYYNLPPLGDDRDEAIVEGEKAPSDNPTPPQLAAFTGQTPPPAEPEQPEPEQPTPADDTEDEADPDMREDLLRWQRKAYKRAKAGQRAACAFESDVIPASLHAAIKGALESASTALDVRRIFGTLIGTDIEPERIKSVMWGNYP